MCEGYRKEKRRQYDGKRMKFSERKNWLNPRKTFLIIGSLRHGGIYIGVYEHCLKILERNFLPWEGGGVVVEIWTTSPFFSLPTMRDYNSEATGCAEISKTRSETADIRVRRKKGSTVVWVNDNGRRPQREKDLEVFLTGCFMQISSPGPGEERLISAYPVHLFFFHKKRRKNAMKHILKIVYCIWPDKSLLYLFINYIPSFQL